MPTTTNLEEAQSFSMLDWRPVFVGNFCFWFGLLMPKSYAFMIANSKCCRAPVTPSMKKEAYEEYYFMFDELLKFDYDPRFSLGEYKSENVWKYLNKELYDRTNEGQLLQHWKNNPKAIIEHFYIRNQ